MIIRFCMSVMALAVLPAAVNGAGNAPQPGICTRACWAARAPAYSATQMGALTRAIVHHTAGNEFNTSGLEASKANVRAVQNLHINNGWGDVGYHFLVDKFGNIFEGRAGSMSGLPRGAHDGTNTNSFGFNLMGYFHPGVNNVPTTAMMNAMYSVIAWRMPSAWRPHGSPGVYGPLGNSVGYLDAHRRVKSTACPGDHVYNPYMGSNVNAGTMRAQVLSRINGVPQHVQANAGWYRVSDASWHLRNSLSGGASDITTIYGIAGTPVVPVTGDWDGNGSKTIGWFRPSDNSWHLSNSNTNPTSNYTAVYGVDGCNPVTGDWDNNGRDSLGWYRQSDGSWHLSNGISGAPDTDYPFVFGTSGVIPVTGDWNGNGSTTVGWYRASDASWHLTNSHSGGASDITCVYGLEGSGIVPVTGDWDANGSTTIGWFRNSDDSWHLSNTFAGADSDITFVLGDGDAIPVVW
jgi:hypothetical protein